MEKRFVWIKLKQDFFDSPEMDWIHEQPNGAEYIYIYLRLCLLSINDDGIIERRIGPLVMPYSIPKLAEKVKTTPDALTVALSLFKEIGLIEDTNGIYAVPGLANMVGSESASAERVRKYRLRKRQSEENLLPEGTPKALHCNEKVTKNVTLEIRDKSIEIRDKKNIKKKSLSSLVDSLSCGEELKKALNDWVEMRKKIKKPVTERAFKMGLNKLQELCGDDETKKTQVVLQSVFHDYQGFWPLKQSEATRPAADRREKIRQAMEKGGGWDAWTK